MVATVRKVRGLFVALFALCVALTALPSVAHATEATGTQRVTITNLQAGDTVNIYKVVEYTYNDGKDTYGRDFVAGLGGALSGVTINQFDGMTDNSDAVKAVAEDMAAWARVHATPQTVSVTGTSVEVDLAAGEYLVLVTPGKNNTTAVYQNALIKVEPTKPVGQDWQLVLTPESLPMKQSTIDIEKGIADDEGKLQESTDKYSVGDEVEFTIRTTIPVYDENVTTKTFMISDTMKNLTLVGAPVVKVGDDTLTNDTHYTYTPGEKSFTIDFTDSYADIEQYAGQTLTVTYKATIDDTAAHNVPGTNDVALDFTNGEKVVHDTDHVDVYTYQLKIEKVDDKDNTLKLEGAVFGVYTDANCTEASKVKEITTNDQGIATIDGLEAGTYYLKEITAPQDYQLDESVITIDVNANTDGDGDTLRVVSETITNSKTPALPVTGGAGTVAITAAGVVLVAGAAMLIVRARKNNN